MSQSTEPVSSTNSNSISSKLVPPTEPVSPSAEQVQAMTEAFLRWRLPDSVRADLCATKQGPGRIGTNLLTFTEAKKMFEDIVVPQLNLITVPTEDHWMRQCAKQVLRVVDAEAEVRRLTAALAEKDKELKALNEGDMLVLPKSAKHAEGMLVVALSIPSPAKDRIASQQEALVAARDALFPLAHVATFAERHKDATGIWNHSDTHGPSFVLTVGHCRNAQAALARVNACLPEVTP